MRSSLLPASDGHQLAVHEAGRHWRDGGIPVLVLHGGPGSGQSPGLWLGLDADRFHLIAPDQRGCGASTPRGATKANTLAHLLADLRHLRQHVGGPPWLVVGGSWGATLAVAHAADHPEAIAALLLRASFLGRPQDLAAFFAAPAPSATAEVHARWQTLSAALGPRSADEPVIQAIARQLRGAADGQTDALLQAWTSWEHGQSSAGDDLGPPPMLDDAQRDRLRVQAQVLTAEGGLHPPLLARASQVPAVPTLLLHGDQDRTCPMAGAQELAQALPAGCQARLQVVAGAGHSPHAGMQAALRQALDHYARHRGWPTAQLHARA